MGVGIGAIVGAVGGTTAMPLCMYGIEYASEGSCSGARVVMPCYITIGCVVGCDAGAAIGQLVKDKADHLKNSKHPQK